MPRMQTLVELVCIMCVVKVFFRDIVRITLRIALLYEFHFSEFVLNQKKVVRLDIIRGISQTSPRFRDNEGWVESSESIFQVMLLYE